MKTQLINSYLDYWNNYLTVEKFADDNGITYYDAATIIQMGKKYNEEAAERKNEIELREKKVNTLTKELDSLFEELANAVRPQ